MKIELDVTPEELHVISDFARRHCNEYTFHVQGEPEQILAANDRGGGYVIAESPYADFTMEAIAALLNGLMRAAAAVQPINKRRSE